MGLETAAKLLEEDREGAEKTVLGDFWIENEHYRVRVKELNYLSGVKVEMEPGEMGDHMYSGKMSSLVEDRVGIRGEDRSIVYREGNPELPSDNEELEAYVRSAFRIK